MDFNQDNEQGKGLGDLFAQFDIKKDGTLCRCLQEAAGEGKGPEDVSAKHADLAIMARAEDTGNILSSAVHVLFSLVRAGIAERVLHEATVEAAKNSFVSELMEKLVGGAGQPDESGLLSAIAGLLGRPGIQVLELAPKGLRLLGDQAPQDARLPARMDDGYL